MMLWEASVLVGEAVHPGLLRAVPLVLNRGARRRPMGLPVDRFHTRRSKWWTRTASSRPLRPDRPGVPRNQTWPLLLPARGCLHGGSTGSFGVVRPGQRMSLQEQIHKAADFGHLQLEVMHPTASRDELECPADGYAAPQDCVAFVQVARRDFVALRLSVNQGPVDRQHRARGQAAVLGHDGGQPDCQGVRTMLRPSASVCTAHDRLKCAVPGISSALPGGSGFSTTISLTPRPLSAWKYRSASAVYSDPRRPPSPVVMTA